MAEQEEIPEFPLVLRNTYHFIELIGHGSTASVCLYKHTKQKDLLVAIKLENVR